MDTFRPRPEEYESMTSQEAREFNDEQIKICEMLSKQGVTSLDQVPKGKISLVQLHILTCPEQHYAIPQLMFGED